jgi:hypothetical protein
MPTARHGKMKRGRGGKERTATKKAFRGRRLCPMRPAASEVEERILVAAAKLFLKRGFNRATDIRPVIRTAPPSTLRNICHVPDGPT